MEYDDEGNGAAGSIPEFGAIFMSSTLTMKECFKRNIFALPSSKAEFVKQIKAGMVLFLFEFEKRKLFGVYQATSDGTIDIVPHGFNYSGRHFPAQVSFATIWVCSPVPEKDFRDAITENYFSGKKFNFGLSEIQVRRLLFLFSSRKLQHKLSPRLITEVHDGAAGGAMLNANAFSSSERTYVGHGEHDELDSPVFCNYQERLLTKPQRDKCLMEGEVNLGNTESLTNGFLKEYHGDFCLKKRRLDESDCLLWNDGLEDETVDKECDLRPSYFDSSKYYLAEFKRSADIIQSLAVGRPFIENQGDQCFNPLHSSKYSLGTFDVRMGSDDFLVQRGSLAGESNLPSGLGRAFVCNYPKHLNKSRKSIDVDGYLIDDCAQRGNNAIKPVAYDGGNLNALSQAREIINDHPGSLNGKLGNRYHMNYDGSPMDASGQLCGNPSGLNNTTGGDRFRFGNIIDGESYSGPYTLAGLSSESSRCPTIYDQRATHDGKFPVMERSRVDDIQGSNGLLKNSRYISNVRGLIANDGSFREIDIGKYLEGNHEAFRTAPLTGYSPYSRPKQNLSLLSDKHWPGTSLSRSKLAQCATVDDATITRATRYSPEDPNIAHRFSISSAADLDSSLMPDNHPYYSSLSKLHSLSNSKPPVHLLEPEILSRSMDVLPEIRIKGLPTDIVNHRSSLLKETTLFPRSNLSEHMILDTSAPADYRGALFSNHSLTSVPPPNHENFPDERSLSFAYPSKSSENSTLDENLPAVSKCLSKLIPWQDMNMLASKGFHCSEAKDSMSGIYNQQRYLSMFENEHPVISKDMYLMENMGISEAPHPNPSVNRRSVFSHLTSDQEVQVCEARDDRAFGCSDSYIDASADEVMEMLQQCNNMEPKKPRKLIVVEQPKHGEHVMKKNLVETNNSTLEKKELKDSYVGNSDCKDEALEDIRILNFRRRSERKKSLAGPSSDSIANGNVVCLNGEVDNSMLRIMKRKKLVRPVFGKTEPAMYAVNSKTDQIDNGQLLNKDDGKICEGVVGICEAKTPNDNALSGHVLARQNLELMGFNEKEHPNCKEPKNIGDDGLSSTSRDFKGHMMSNVDRQTGFQVFPRETSEGKGQISKGFMTQDIDTSIRSPNLEKSSTEGLKLSYKFCELQGGGKAKSDREEKENYKN